jgi:hypothetical protein
MFKVTEYQAGRLINSAYSWANVLAKYADQYENYTEGSSPFKPIFPGWKFAYFVGDNYSAVILFCAYLESISAEFEVIWNACDYEDPEWCVVTSVRVADWAKSLDKSNETN